MNLGDHVAVTVEEARDHLPELVSRAAHGRERIVLAQGGKNLAALISLDELLSLEQIIEKLEDLSDLEAITEALDEAKVKGTVSWEKVKEELGL